MKHVYAVLISGCLAVGGGGLGVAGISYGSHSPRLLIAGLAAAVIGIGLGSFLLQQAIERAAGIRLGVATAQR